MPAAPPWRTLKPLLTRALTPREHTTIWPVKVPGAAGTWQRGSAVLRTTGDVATGPITEDPLTVRESEPEATEAEPWKERSVVLAATVVTQGPRCPVVSAAGPSLPAE